MGSYSVAARPAAHSLELAGTVSDPAKVYQESHAVTFLPRKPVRIHLRKAGKIEKILP